jgi:hypothetical protein
VLEEQPERAVRVRMRNVAERGRTEDGARALVTGAAERRLRDQRASLSLLTHDRFRPSDVPESRGHPFGQRSPQAGRLRLGGGVDRHEDGTDDGRIPER